MEITSVAKIVSDQYKAAKCPACLSPILHYEMRPYLEIDFEDIARKLDEFRRKQTGIFVKSPDCIRLQIQVSSSIQDVIYGIPVKYEIISVP